MIPKILKTLIRRLFYPEVLVVTYPPHTSLCDRDKLEEALKKNFSGKNQWLLLPEGTTVQELGQPKRSNLRLYKTLIVSEDGIREGVAESPASVSVGDLPPVPDHLFED